VGRENPSGVQKIPPGQRMVTAEAVAEELQGRVKALAFPGQPGESVKACLNRVAREAGLTTSEAKRIWYREMLRIPAHLADRIRTAAKEHDRKLDERISAARARQDRLYALIHHSSDPDFYSARAVGPGGCADDCGGKDSETQ
jgi:hypothetical protein